MVGVHNMNWKKMMILGIISLILIVLAYKYGRYKGRIDYGKRFENAVTQLRNEGIVKQVKGKYDGG